MKIPIEVNTPTEGHCLTQFDFGSKDGMSGRDSQGYVMGHTTVRTLQQHYLGLATRTETDAFHAIWPQNVAA